MSDITIEALKLRRRQLEINVAMNQGAIDEIDHIIAEMERRRGGRPRKATAGLTVSNQPETDDEGPLPSIDEVRGILKVEEPTA
jgi:hypothetical protein